MHHLILDVETQKSFDEVGGYKPAELKVSFVGVIERLSLPIEIGAPVKEVRHEFFEESLPRLFKLMEKCEVIVGFNLDGFDMEVLRPYYGKSMSGFATIDLMTRFKDRVGHRISLEAVASETVGAGKSGNGLDALGYYSRGEFDKLAAYCMKDVEITRDVYDYGRLYGKVKYKNKWNEVKEAEVDFGFNKPVDMGLQMSLV